jgi:hypothetical protein
MSNQCQDKDQHGNAPSDAVGLLCYETEAHGIKSFVWATSRGKSVSATYHSANDAGYKTKFTEITARRRKDLDKFKLRNNRRVMPNVPYAVDFIST